MTRDQIVAHLTLHGWQPVMGLGYKGIKRVHGHERIVYDTTHCGEPGIVYKVGSPPFNIRYAPIAWTDMHFIELRRVWTRMKGANVI